mmetsp:Transcript_17883/g.27803  ORF Transcript_17883/g.27803 Transcript_17883/m.27803 type:complete len:290 (-) Transcript_17883:475-1344(-)|eukprot:CAMPEP_0196807010 /NCGR_PEP_ID=MMETSP1362-20130617/6951_1 /TAXON_ID=163516 /ORGANISM="Leptocylindrus danicus, Strain CCMP1856" /LENGTH=289 /DNA_ID=CAMNT_0042180743 /DNA_START=39 /DNA_END=911 /DNA_ORIENTATION=-
MGNTTSSGKPKNKTGKAVVKQKLENATKTGVLSLQQHKLDVVPAQVFSLTNLRTLDVSHNNLKKLSQQPLALASLTNLKIFKCNGNKLVRGSLDSLPKLEKLQVLTAGDNRLGRPLPSPDKSQKVDVAMTPLPAVLPPSLKEVYLDSNYLEQVPLQLCSLVKLQILNLSGNSLVSIPVELCTSLKGLAELILDDNQLTSLPDECGKLKKLKVLSLRNNCLSGSDTPQSIPASIFSNTPVIDLNLSGNKITSTELNEFEGFDKFLERRKKVKNKDLAGFDQLDGADICGL